MRPFLHQFIQFLFFRQRLIKNRSIFLFPWSLAFTNQSRFFLTLHSRLCMRRWAFHSLLSKSHECDQTYCTLCFTSASCVFAWCWGSGLLLSKNKQESTKCQLFRFSPQPSHLLLGYNLNQHCKIARCFRGIIETFCRHWFLGDGRSPSPFSKEGIDGLVHSPTKKCLSQTGSQVTTPREFRPPCRSSSRPLRPAHS